MTVLRRPRGETSEPERTGRLLEFLNLGYIDYVAARTLLINALPLQGAVLASTAIEKYFKAFGHVFGNSLKGHLQASHLNLMRDKVPDLFAKLNPEFLSFLKRCYDLRYTDCLEPDFNATVYAREVLAELDHTVFHCDSQINLRRDQVRVLSPFGHAVEKKSRLLFAENHILLGIDKEAFLSSADTAYAIRNRPVEGILEIEFTVAESPKDGRFNREGLKPVI